MKRINVFWLSLLMSLTALPVSAFDFEIDGIKYDITGANEVCVSSGGDKKAEEIVIPETVTNDGTTYNVTAIGEKAFYLFKMTSVTIPNSIKKIGNNAFRVCTNLSSINIPASVQEIGNNAFQLCKNLSSVNINDVAAWCNIEFCDSLANPTTITTGLYLNGNKVTELVIPDGVTKIGKYAFFNCYDLASVTIPNSVTEIGEYAFKDCDGLTSVTIPNSVTEIDKYAFSGCNGLKSVTIPNSITKIGADAFENCTGLTSVNINDIAAWCNIVFDSETSNPLSIANNLYINGEKITELVIPDGVTKIGQYAFCNCADLTSVTIPNSITEIGVNAFAGRDKSAKLNINDIVAWCNIVFHSGTSNPLNISNNLYLNGEKITELIIPDGVTKIGQYAFYRCGSLTSVTIPNSVTEIGEGAFSVCYGLTSVVIPNSITVINNSVFSSCTGLTSVEIPNSVTEIGDDAFYVCYGLTSITIPNSVTKIGRYAFYDCRGLTSIYSLNPTPPTINNTFGYMNMGDIYRNATLYVPKNALEAYRTRNEWMEFTNIQGIDISGIKDVKANVDPRQNTCYDLNGRKLNGPKTGLNIINGKKVMVKNEK